MKCSFTSPDGSSFVCGPSPEGFSLSLIPASVSNSSIDKLLEQCNGLIQDFGLLINRHTFACRVFYVPDLIELNTGKDFIIQLPSIDHVPDDLRSKIIQVDGDENHGRRVHLKVLDAIVAGHMVLLGQKLG